MPCKDVNQRSKCQSEEYIVVSKSKYTYLYPVDVPGVCIARSLLVVAHWGVSDEFDCGWLCDDGSVEDNGDGDAPIELRLEMSSS